MRLARWWADPKLVKANDDLRYRLVNAEAASERLKQERDRALADLGKSIETNDRWEQVFDEQARSLTAEQQLTQQLSRERDEARRELAEQVADNVIKTDQLRTAEASLIDARDNERAAIRARDREREETALLRAELVGKNREIERLNDLDSVQRRRVEDLEAELAEARATIDGLGLKLAIFERAEAVADETRAKRYYDGLGDE